MTRHAPLSGTTTITPDSNISTASSLRDEHRKPARMVAMVRAIPISWRIISIAALNSAVVLMLGALIWKGSHSLSTAFENVRQVRTSEQILTMLESETVRLQSLIHRYINRPSPELFAEILLLREAVLGSLSTRASNDPMLSGSVAELEEATDSFLSGFGEVRAVQAAITRTYDEQVVSPARDIALLYSEIENATPDRASRIMPTLGRSRDAFTAFLVAANSYYLSPLPSSADQARHNTDTITRTIPVMLELSENDQQRVAIHKLHEMTIRMRDGLGRLSEQLAQRASLLRYAIDGSQAKTINVIDAQLARIREHEKAAQGMFDTTLSNIGREVWLITGAFLALIIIASILITLSIRRPLRQLMGSMQTIVSGNLDARVSGTSARDEIGAMARAVEVFRANAIDKRAAEQQLREAKERAEHALEELNTAQRNLIDAERLAALGGLVAGVAHEVNNPVGISLTVASSLARRVDEFESELAGKEPLRRSRLQDFIAQSKDAARQLVANLHRAGDLIQSFKQVAVDRSTAELRQFNLSEATEQIVTSLRPVLRNQPISLEVNVPSDLEITGYPGFYGQILTNLFMNAATHAFQGQDSGKICISARPYADDKILIVFKDDGIGMPHDVLRQAFDPFFTTRRNEGGTGLGLHIVYNLVSHQLGGDISVDSKPGHGTEFHIIMPRIANAQADKTVSNTGLK